MTTVFVLCALALLVIYLLSKKTVTPNNEHPLFNPKWRTILKEKVAFYAVLSQAKQAQFERDVSAFLKNTKITGIETEIDEVDKLLVASGAIIPVLAFPDWTYKNLDEVLIYPDLFNRNFETKGENRLVSGMVGSGVMNGKMILSKKSLHLGFSNQTDKKNVAIHEFVHLIDMADGVADGIPALLIDKTFVLPWLELIRTKVKEIEKGKSDINLYGATAVHEFFPVVAEYFFERPKLLKKKHPKLFAELDEIFNPK